MKLRIKSGEEVLHELPTLIVYYVIVQVVIVALFELWKFLK